MNLITAYETNYPYYIDFLKRVLKEKSISSKGIDYKLAQIKREYDLHKFEKDFTNFDKNSLNLDEKQTKLEESQSWLNKGNIYFDLRNAFKAIKCYDIAINFDKTNMDALNKKGLILQDLGKYEESADCYSQALQEIPNDSHSWENLSI